MSIKSAELFEKMKPVMATSGPDLVKKIGASYLFEIRADKTAKPHLFTVDLKSGTGAIHNGKEGTPDATFTMLDDDFIALAQGKLNPQSAFMTGKMKIKGNMAKAMKFTPDILPKDAKL